MSPLESQQPDGDGGHDIAGSRKNVLIIGAGPAGLLAAIFLLRRNDSNPDARYDVTIVDPGVDYGALDSEGLCRRRSWMIGLSCHGLKAIKRVPGLYENYISNLGLNIKYAVTGFGNFKIKQDAKDLRLSDDAFVVDRNYIVAGLARYLNDNFGDSVHFRSLYETRAVFVDGDYRRVLVRDNKAGGGDSAGPFSPNATERYLQYDLLLGCDGIRSVARNAFVSTHRDFEFDMKGTFGIGKSVHIPLPDDVEEATFMFLAQCVPDCNAFVLPETGKMLNIGMGFKCSKPIHPDLLSDDLKTVSDYFRDHFKAFSIDPDLFAKEWINQTWNTINMVHCNFYHSEQLQALLLGDAAHATSPQIGQGMNTALADAEALNDLLDMQGDNNLDAVLPRFSAERVKEGNALTDLSFYTFSLSASQQMRLMIQQQLHDFLHRCLPFLFDMFPMTAIASDGLKLSEAYNKMHKIGVIQKVRRTNDKIMREHFEREVGMLTDKRKRGGSLLFVVGVAAATASIFFALLRAKQ